MPHQYTPSTCHEEPVPRPEVGDGLKLYPLRALDTRDRHDPQTLAARLLLVEFNVRDRNPIRHRATPSARPAQSRSHSESASVAV